MKSWLTDHLYGVVIAGILALVVVGVWVATWFVGPIDFGPIVDFANDLLGVATLALLIIGNMLLIFINIFAILLPGVMAVKMYARFDFPPVLLKKTLWIAVFSLLGGQANVIMALLFVHLKPWLVISLGNALQGVVDGELVIPWFVAGMVMSLAGSKFYKPKSK